MNLITPKAGAKHELLFNKPASGSLSLSLQVLIIEIVIITAISMFLVQNDIPNRQTYTEEVTYGDTREY